MLKYLKDVTTLALDTDKCIGCRKCTEVCPHGVFKIADKKVLILDKNSCMECGACAMNCSVNALEVNAGVGCATAIIMSWFTGKEPSCDCSSGDCC
jgi:NAD-dependent dihydropyrimidine dehydrogenase PreA subunit